MSKEIRVKYQTLVATINQALATEGVPAPVRDVEAAVMAEADLLGVPSHGVRMLPGLIQALREGRATRDPRLRLERDRAATCVLDGDNGPGRYVAAQAMQHAVERAKHFGVGVCLATRTTHWGRAHAYAYRATQAGMIGLCTTNAIPNMLAWGSTRPVLGNNPLAVGIPRAQGQDPIVLDMAMSQASVGKIGTYLREGKPVPLGWGLDSSGQPTDNPAAILSSGSVLPMGDHKGAGLAMMMELLTSALAGGLLSHEIVQVEKTGLDPNATKFFLALDVDMFVERECFLQKVEDLLAYLQSATGPAPDFVYPGERGWQTRERYLAEGISIHADIAAQLESAGISLPHD
jgi:LDH2 family malate/lactate/ureidoglycolate dehydrogenase